MRTDLFDYALPPERIAQTPLPRGESRLLVLHRKDGRCEHRRFAELLDYLRAGDTLVLNDTRVSARRLAAQREGGQAAEAFLLRPLGETDWEALVKPGRALKPGKTLTLFAPDGSRLTAQITATTPEGGRILTFPDSRTRDALATWGVTPLPPYIHVPLPAREEARYQTVYAAHDGSAAAPTAGLHFTPELLERAQERGVALAKITLHVGVGTFRPVRDEEIEAHTMHAESFAIAPETADIINATSGRVFAVGTTSVRALESAALSVLEGGVSSAPTSERAGRQAGIPARVAPGSLETCLFITPGYQFRVADALITNFHLPRSTLLMLVSAFAGRENVLRAYQEAIEREYRFFSFGDAMLIV